MIREGKPDYFFSYYKDGFLESKNIKMPEGFGGLNTVDRYSYKFWK